MYALIKKYLLLKTASHHLNLQHTVTFFRCWRVLRHCGWLLTDQGVVAEGWGTVAIA